jgi:uncharacterized membrane protein YebE (DUF533 family)
MTRETDAVIFTRRDTWRKAIAAARSQSDRWAHPADESVERVIIEAMVDAARADGVTFDETSP